jgi:hypothetical protein
MTLLGWIFMLVSTLSVATLTFWCFYRVLNATEKPSEQVERFHSA